VSEFVCVLPVDTGAAVVPALSDKALQQTDKRLADEHLDSLELEPSDELLRAAQPHLFYTPPAALHTHTNKL